MTRHANSPSSSPSFSLSTCHSFVLSLYLTVRKKTLVSFLSCVIVQQHKGTSSSSSATGSHIERSLCTTLQGPVALCMLRTAGSRTIHVQGAVVADLNRILWMVVSLVKSSQKVMHDSLCACTTIRKCTCPHLGGCVCKMHSHLHLFPFICACLPACKEQSCSLSICELPESVFNY